MSAFVLTSDQQYQFAIWSTLTLKQNGVVVLFPSPQCSPHYVLSAFISSMNHAFQPPENSGYVNNYPKVAPAYDPTFQTLRQCKNVEYFFAFFKHCTENAEGSVGSLRRCRKQHMSLHFTSGRLGKGNVSHTCSATFVHEMSGTLFLPSPWSSGNLFLQIGYSQSRVFYYFFPFISCFKRKINITNTIMLCSNFPRSHLSTLFQHSITRQNYNQAS